MADTGTASYWDEMKGLYRQQQEETVAANNAAAEDAVRQAQSAAAARREALNGEYQGVNRQLYRDYMSNQKALPQQLSAQGFSGGMTESARLRLRNGYEETLAENERARLGQLNAGEAELADRLYEIRADADAANRQARQTYLSYIAALRGEQYDEEYAQRQDIAKTMAGIGDFSALADIGYSEAQIAALQANRAAKNAKTSRSGSGGRTKKTDGDEETAEIDSAGETATRFLTPLPAGYLPDALSGYFKYSYTR